MKYIKESLDFSEKRDIAFMKYAEYINSLSDDIQNRMNNCMLAITDVYEFDIIRKPHIKTINQVSNVSGWTYEVFFSNTDNIDTILNNIYSSVEKLKYDLNADVGLRLFYDESIKYNVNDVFKSEDYKKVFEDRLRECINLDVTKLLIFIF